MFRARIYPVLILNSHWIFFKLVIAEKKDVHDQVRCHHRAEVL